VFFLPGYKLSCKNAARHAIQLQLGVTPINTRPYRLPESQREETDRQVKQLIEDGIIAKSDSSWNSPFLVVAKKVGPDEKRKWRLVVDFRKLNEKTFGDAYPLPDITEILEQLGQSKYFTCLDMVMGYHQIELAPGEGTKTAFSTKQSHWEYRRLPFGLKGPCYIAKNDEFGIEWANWYALFCVFGRYRHLCQIAGGSQC